MSEPESIKEIIKKEDVEVEKIGTLKKQGGFRKNAGRKIGSVNKTSMTRTKTEAKERFISRVQQNVDTLFNAQLALAKGEQHLFVKYHVGTGKDRRAHIDIVTDPETISNYLTDYGQSLNKQSDDEYYYIATKPANNQAIDSLLNRAFGKAPEKIEVEGGFFKAEALEIKIVKPDHIVEGEVVENSNDE